MTDAPQSDAPAPGWYPDPEARHELRYWNGTTWTDSVANRGTVTQDPLANALAATPRRARSAKWIIYGFFVASAIVILGVLIANSIEGSRGADPRDRLETIRDRLSAAGIICYDWQPSTPVDGLRPATTASVQCTLATGDKVRIETFRENRDKGSPPCPRLEGDTYWIDTSGVKTQNVVPRLAAALDAKTIANCTTPSP